MLLRDLILARLEALGWTQTDLARATNIPKQNLSPILRGARPLLAVHLLAIDAVLHLGVDYGGLSVLAAPSSF